MEEIKIRMKKLVKVKKLRKKHEQLNLFSSYQDDFQKPISSILMKYFDGDQ